MSKYFFKLLLWLWQNAVSLFVASVLYHFGWSILTWQLWVFAIVFSILMTMRDVYVAHEAETKMAQKLLPLVNQLQVHAENLQKNKNDKKENA